MLKILASKNKNKNGKNIQKIRKDFERSFIG